MYGCVKTKSLPSPQLTAAAFSISGDGGCAPFNVTFSDSSSNAVSWSWQFGDGAVSNVQQPTNSYASDGYYDVTLIVTSASGCKDTLVVDSMIEVNTPVANFSVDTLEGCSPLFVNFTDQV
ncbi:MAG: PKD domain-containing protein [Bacteroidetes bacterium]|nr:PKD domain-containing protein [Bacteroidota bacterium]